MVLLLPPPLPLPCSKGGNSFASGNFPSLADVLDDLNADLDAGLLSPFVAVADATDTFEGALDAGLLFLSLLLLMLLIHLKVPLTLIYLIVAVADATDTFEADLVPVFCFLCIFFITQVYDW
jgi:hypothetical protein